MNRRSTDREYEDEPRPLTPPTEYAIEFVSEQDAPNVWAKYTKVPWEFWQQLGCTAKWPKIEFTFKETELRKARKIRDLTAKTQDKKYRWENPPGFAVLWPSPEDGPHPEIWLCEGERDAGVLRYNGWDSYTLGSCTSYPDVITMRIMHEVGVERVNVLFDADKSGQEHDRKVAELLADDGFRVKRLPLGTVCRQYEKDVSDIWQYRNPVEFREAMERLIAESEAVEDIRMDAVLEGVRDPAWIWDGLLPRAAVTLFSGPPKAMKTNIIYFIMRAMRSGGSLLGREIVPGKVLYYSEMSRWIDKARRDKILAILGENGREHVFMRNIHSARMAGKTWPERVSVLERDCERYGIDLLIIDTAVSWFEFVGDDENNSVAVAKAFAPLGRLADASGIAVKVVHHTGISNPRPRGSSAFEGTPDVLLTQTRNSQDNLELTITGRSAKSHGRIVWNWPEQADEPVVFSDEELPEIEIVIGADGKKSSTEEIILGLIPEPPGAVTQREIQDSPGVVGRIGQPQVSKIVKKLLQQKLITCDRTDRWPLYSRVVIAVEVELAGKNPDGDGAEK